MQMLLMVLVLGMFSDAYQIHPIRKANRRPILPTAILSSQPSPHPPKLPPYPANRRLIRVCRMAVVVLRDANAAARARPRNVLRRGAVLLQEADAGPPARGRH